MKDSQGIGLKKILLILFAAGAIGAFACYKILLNPNSRIMLLLQGKISNIDSRVITGPYPSERDFIMFKKNGIGLDVCLLNPALPYEKPLIEAEKKLAEKYNIEFVNYPMNPVSSMMGAKGGEKNREYSEEAVEKIMATNKKVYLHCYLGRHRVKIISDLLKEKGLETGKYLVKESERLHRAQKLDQAQADYDARKFENVIKELGDIKAPAVQETMLLAWSNYRLNRIKEAEELFSAVINMSPETSDAHSGLGYCLLRSGNPAEAEKAFSRALAVSPEDAQSLAGLGISYFRQGRLQEAGDALDKSLKIAPENSEAKDILSKIRGSDSSE